MKNDGITEELLKIYKKAATEGIWICEFAPGDEGKYLAAAGQINSLDNLENKLRESGYLRRNEELDVYKIPFGVLVEISLPGIGESREQACRKAVKAWKEYQKIRHVYKI